jgi:hypothetical protein
MLKLTQTNLDPGNCWQTAVACLLGVPAEALPDQHLIESRHKDGSVPDYAGHHSYSNALNAYLFKHHGLGYMQEPAWKLGAFTLRDPGLHLLIGPTVRTCEGGDGARILHCVVGRHGEQVWDPHPSRAGLLSVISWGWLADVSHISTIDQERGYGWHWSNPVAAEADRVRWANRTDEAPGVSALCCCPKCFVASADPFVDGEYVR